ncbi:MAG: alanine--tRNA ligase [Patescibacteria group bacterium]
MIINSFELRKKYLEFFKSKNHAIISSASLIPENDPTVLFTTAGMHPLVPYLLGEEHPAGKRLTDVQKCVRTGDIDEVGDFSHLTFFEMLGNWSLGDYFKEDSIKWSFEFLTDKKWLGLDIRKLAVTVFEGDKDAPKDEFSAEIWKKTGISENRIAYLPKKNNWWGPAGQTGPCGPDTEIFYWRGKSEFPSENSNPRNDEENWLEIWNNVFMEYFKDEEGKYNVLKQKNVDTGMGLERTVLILNGLKDIYEIDTLKPIIKKIENISQKKYRENEVFDKSMRIIADHLRTATMIMTDNRGIAPGNVDQSYIVRRLIRRAVRHGKIIGIEHNFCREVAAEVINIFSDIYEEVNKNKDFALNELEKEEEKFNKTLEQGIKEFDKILNGLKIAFEKTGNKINEISGKQAFKLYDTFGFPLEMTEELAKEHNLTVDNLGFKDAFEKHQELSREGAEQKFKGGLADQSEMSTKYHTATHLLHAALKKILGEHVAQRGSNINTERMRFDFSHPEKMTDEQKQLVEELVNYAIEKKYPISFVEMSVEEAKKIGAIGLFENKYGEKVKVYSVGDPNKIPNAEKNSPTFSKEICGGPHVENTSSLGKFKIIKEEAVSSGVRRIKAILE